MPFLKDVILVSYVVEDHCPLGSQEVLAAAHMYEVSLIQAQMFVGAFLAAHTISVVASSLRFQCGVQRRYITGACICIYICT